MKNTLVIVFAATVFFGLYQALDHYVINPDVAFDDIDPGRKEVSFLTAPLFKLTDYKDKEVSITNFQDKIVIVNFWASTCGPCVDEFPSLVRYIQRFPGKVALLAVSQDQDVSAMNKFIHKYYLEPNSSVFIMSDLNRSVARTYGVKALPESFIFAHGLKFARKIVGYRDWLGPSSIDEINNLLKE